MNNLASISVVIPNYNGQYLLEDTIKCAIRALETSSIKDYEIIVSDDASTDDSINVILKNFSNVQVIESPLNTGFSGNVNRGIFASNKELILLLNSDLHLSEGYFTSLIPLFKDDQTFGVMGLIKDSCTNENVDGAKIPKMVLYNIESNKNILDAHSVLPTFFLSGANALIRADYLKKMGGFCELFNPYYSEDVELGIRAWRMGWGLYFQPEAICYHATSSTIKKLKSNDVQVIAKRNKYLLHVLHLPSFLVYVYLFNISFNGCIKYILGKKTHLHALRYLFANWSTIQKEKNMRKNTKTLSFVLTLPQIIRKIKTGIKKANYSL